MQKLSNQSKDISQENIKKVEELFPNCVTETYDQDGTLVRSIDFDILRQDLSDHVVEGPKERYQFDWPGKREAILLANAPTTNTLRPLPEKSVDFENTKNVYIEGDNLEALKILRETYMGKIKMIYIDPPYNTGNDFVYKDNFKQSTEEYLKSSGSVDEEGNRMEVNGESNGRFHSDWLNMMYPRLVLARDLLTDDGAIFASIDDNEQANLVELLNLTFGEQNKVAEFVVIRSEGGGMAKQVIKGHDYLFVYAKNINLFSPLGRPKDVRGKVIEKGGEKYWIQEDWLRKEFGKYGNCYYEEIEQFKGKDKLNEINEGLKKGSYILLPKSNGMHIVGKLRNLKDDSSKFYSILKHLSAEGIKDLKELGLENYFSYPKPVSLIEELVNGMTIFSAKKNDIIMDFFSGSATTAHAIMELNHKDNGNRKYILVQFPEQLSPDLQNPTNNFKNICDIGEERIRRSGEMIKESNPLTCQNMDTGFRVYQIDSSNMKDILSTPKETQLSLLENAESAIKPDRNPLDLVTQVMLQLGITLDADIKIGKFSGGEQFYAVNGNDLVCCFDKISESSIEEMARMQPLNVAFRDDSFASDQDEVNCEQIFKTLSPITGKNIFVL